MLRQTIIEMIEDGKESGITQVLVQIYIFHLHFHFFHI